MANIIELTEKELPDNCLVYKHSTQCGLSKAAADEVNALGTDLPIYWINVIEQRPLSNWVAEQYGIRHESPQLLLLEEGEVKSVWNHHQVKRSEIEKSV